MKRKYYYFSVLLLFALLLTKIVDFTVFWNLSKSETNYCWNSLVMTGESISLEHLGFSNRSEAQKKLIKIAEQKKEKIVSVSYYNLLYPNAYLIYNKSGNIKKEYFSLPWISVQLDEGINEVYFFKFDLVIIKSKSGIKYRCVEMGYSFLPMGILYDYQANIDNKLSFPFSSALPEFINRIHLYYYFIPLFLIIILTFRYSKAIWIAFYYFFIMLFLFYIAAFWFPHLYIIKIIYKVQIPKILSILFLLLNVITYFIFYKGIKIGKKYIKENGISLEEKFIVAYFLLLPIVLRF